MLTEEELKYLHTRLDVEKLPAGIQRKKANGFIFSRGEEKTIRKVIALDKQKNIKTASR